MMEDRYEEYFFMNIVLNQEQMINWKKSLFVIEKIQPVCDKLLSLLRSDGST